MAKIIAIMILSVLLCIYNAEAQDALWVTQLAGIGDGDGRACTIAPNGNVYIAGSFSATMDIDPSPSVYNVSSNGQKDVFLACYNSSGGFLWGFSFGSSDNDYVKNLAVDNNSNAIVVGQYRGTGIDFDPGAGIKKLNATGWVDGFVAVYSNTGSLLWAHTLGGTGDYDDAQSVVADPSGNIYVGGNFHSLMDIDPNPAANTYLNSSFGTAFLIKYSPSGQLVWGFNFAGGGNAGTDNGVWGMKADNDGFIYLTGCYTGSNSDFDPSPAKATLSASAAYDGYLAKYSTDGAFQYVVDIKGSGSDQAIDIALDEKNDIYLIGYTESPSLRFSSSTGNIPRPSGSDKANIFIARYSNSGQVKWGHIIGAQAIDFGWGITVANGFVYCTGYFQNTIDFDPGVNVENLAGNGKNDVFLARYDLDGNYICAFNIGDASHDNAYKLTADKAGNLYLCGYFSPSNVDFGPFSSTYNMSSTGGSDVFLAKYDWSNTYTPPSGYLVGDTVCEGDEAFLQFIATAGAGPFLLTYTDGTTVFTQSVTESGERFAVPGRAIKTTQYILTRIKDKMPCTPPGTPNAAASIWVNPKPNADAGADTSVCPGARIQLRGTGGVKYQWYPPDGLSEVTVPDPFATVHQTIFYNVIVTNVYGCVDTGTVTVAIRPADFKVREINDVCIGDTIQLNASGGDTYLWSPADSLYPESSQFPYVWVKQSRDYTVTIKDTVCGRSATLQARVDVHPLPDVRVIIAKDMDCGLDYAQLGAAGALRYAWSPGSSLSDSTDQFVHARPAENTLYTVLGTDNWGCSNTDSVLIRVFSGSGRLFAPDAFTPNNDGKNDCYRVNIPGDISDYDFSIYNRWGQQVFHATDYFQCWDGTYNNNVAELGTYFYFYKATSTICDGVSGKGSLHLVR